MFFQPHKQVDVSVHGPYHANYLYTMDVDEIIGATSRVAFGRSKVYFPFVTEKPFATPPANELLKKCLIQVLCKPLRLD